MSLGVATCSQGSVAKVMVQTLEDSCFLSCRGPEKPDLLYLAEGPPSLLRPIIPELFGPGS